MYIIILFFVCQYIFHFLVDKLVYIVLIIILSSYKYIQKEVSYMRQTTKLLPIYRQIEEYIKELIEQNQHVPNYKLPSENQLANKFGASRITVQKALNNLQDENIIRRIQGKGTFVNTDDTLSLSSLTRTIYLLLPDIDRKYSRQVIEGANEYLNENNINLAIGMTNNNPELEKAKIESAVKQRALGIILFPVIHQTYHNAFLKLALSELPYRPCGAYASRTEFQQCLL